VLPSNGASGSITITVSDIFFELISTHTLDHSITTNIRFRSEGTVLSLTGVHSPQSDAEKIEFLSEYIDLRPLVNLEWLLVGDFNLITSTEDKNNGRVNMQMINRFKRTIDDLQLAKLPLQRRRFTWSNKQDTPIMTTIDHFFGTTEWHDLSAYYLSACFPHCS
jgi:hypothetical protein